MSKITLEKGWMKKQIERAAKEWNTLPAWVKDACGVTVSKEKDKK